MRLLWLLLAFSQLACAGGLSAGKAIGDSEQAIFRPASGGAQCTSTTTWDPANKGTLITLSNGNLTATASSFSSLVRATVGKSSGKWYWELTIGSTVEASGLANASANLEVPMGGVDGNSIEYDSTDGKIYKGGIVVGTGGATYTTSDVIGVAYNADATTVSFYKNGVIQYTDFATLPTGALFPGWSSGGAGTKVVTVNFGATIFTGSIPSGYTCLQ